MLTSRSDRTQMDIRYAHCAPSQQRHSVLLIDVVCTQVGLIIAETGEMSAALLASRVDRAHQL
jgi:hypothetical protein